MAPPRPPRTHAGISSLITVLLVTALAGTLSVPFANRTPVLGDIPRSRWHQSLRVPVMAILLVAHLLIELDVPWRIFSGTRGATRVTNARRLS